MPPDFGRRSHSVSSFSASFSLSSSAIKGASNGVEYADALVLEWRILRVQEC
jgi:hypothetical protein